MLLYLGDAIDRNFDKWGYTFAMEHDYLFPAERNPRTYDEAITQMKTSIVERGAYMDDNIKKLYGYSHDSMNKKFNYS